MDRGAEELPAEKDAPSQTDDYEWLRCLARSSPVGIYRADSLGHCKYVNERWCELTGYPQEAALGVGWERVIHPEDRARELHDSAAQTVAALAMNLSLLTQSGGTMTEEKRTALLADSLELAGTTVRDLRTQSYLLHPPLLDERGLNAALRWFVQGFTERSGITVEIEIDAEFPRLHEQLEMTIFRVIQESLSNVRRHAKSATASVRLAIGSGWVTVEIRDRGCGMPRVDGDGMGVGIAGMRERLLQLGGSLTLMPCDPGTAVIARLPEIL